MSNAMISGLKIGFDIVGDGARAWTLTGGARFGRDTYGLPALAEQLAAHDGRVLLWDRPNCGESDVCFEGDSESAMNADILAALLEHIDMTPALIAGGTNGARVSVLTALHHPEVTAGLAAWLITGGLMGCFTLGYVYNAPSIRAAWEHDMEGVVTLPDWAETIAKNPATRDRILAQNPDEFIALMERWMATYVPRDDEDIPSIPRAALADVTMPALVFNSSPRDAIHQRAVSESVAASLPNSTLVDLPWNEAERDPEADNHPGYFGRWPMLVPHLAAWAESID